MGKHNSKLAPKEIKELSSKTGYTSAEIKEWYKGFLRDCPSGTLNREEFQKVYANFFPNGDSTEFAEHVFQTYDRNGDGNIDFREFLTAMSVTSRGTMEEKLLWAFELYNLNKDGSITKEEMTELIAAIYKMVNVDANPSTSDEPRKSPAERADEIFAIMDRNSDARLTFDEFYEGAKTDASLLRFLEGQS